MKKRFSEEQSGGSAREIARRHNITEQTFYRWRRVYGGMSVSEAKRFKQPPLTTDLSSLSLPDHHPAQTPALASPHRQLTRCASV